MEIKTINLNEETEFEQIVNAHLKDGWEILSTACGFLNSENYNFMTSWQAIMIKRREVDGR